jgi:hypothetical protein
VTTARASWMSSGDLGRRAEGLRPGPRRIARPLPCAVRLANQSNKRAESHCDVTARIKMKETPTEAARLFGQVRQ